MAKYMTPALVQKSIPIIIIWLPPEANGIGDCLLRSEHGAYIPVRSSTTVSTEYIVKMYHN